MTLIAMILWALAQDQVDNPEYGGWKPFKPGSSVTYKMEGGPGIGEQKVTLKSIDDHEAVIETEFNRDGKPVGKAMERKIPAKADSAKAGKKTSEGEEEIEVAGKKLKCKTRDFEKTMSNGKTGSLRFWINEEIPGMVAKMETTTAGSPKYGMIATAWEKK